jgi:hypothetical protein
MFVKNEKETDKRMNSLKRQMMITCYLYYFKDRQIITDDDWQERANELAKLIYDTGYESGLWDDQFEGWTGDTGFHLKYDDWTIDKALQLVRIVDQKEHDKMMEGRDVD